VITVDAGAAREMGRRSARRRHASRYLAGATLASISQKLPELPAGAKVLSFNYDTGERYLSVEGFLLA
jgi:cysteine synthase